jgi:hypothetical protein
MNTNDIIGAIGVGITLIAYFLSVFSIIQRDGALFYWMNILGSGIACFASILIQFWPFIILEGTWVIISIIGLLKSIKKPQELT